MGCGLAQVSLDKLTGSANQRQLRICAGARRERPRQRLDGLRLAVERQAERMIGEQPGPAGPAARRLSMADGVNNLAVLCEPFGGSPVQLRYFIGQPPAQLQPEEVSEQVVVAEPGALGVERYHERVRVFQAEQDPLGARAAGH